MTNTIENEDKNEEIIPESIKNSEQKETFDTVEEEKKPEIIANIVTAKYTRPPMFQKTNNFGKGNFQTNNNRQRPGRAAGRGR